MTSTDIVIDRVALAAWLGDTLGATQQAEALTITRPSGGGWSNDTLFVDLPEGPHRRVVVRLAPTGPAMFPAYDLSHQIAVMRHLAADGRVPVPGLLADDPLGVRLGRPAFVMSFVAGRVPVDDRPSFAEQGFLHDADAAHQRAFHTRLLDAIALIHTTDTTPVPTLTGRGLPSVHAAIDALRATWQFDRGERWATDIDRAFDTLAAEVPESGGDVLLWGDARPANVIVAADGYEPVALLDWELASIGPPELDLTWLAEMNRMRMQGSGIAPIPGFLTDDDAIRYYGDRTGRSLAHLEWYTLYSATRVAALMHRHLRVMVHLGQLPAEHRLLTRTIAVDRVVHLLDVGYTAT